MINDSVAPIKRWAFALLVGGLAVLLVPQVAAAQGTADQRRACESDAFRLCPDAIPDERRIRSCLMRKSRNLSRDCRAVMGSRRSRR